MQVELGVPGRRRRHDPRRLRQEPADPARRVRCRFATVAAGARRLLPARRRSSPPSTTTPAARARAVADRDADLLRGDPSRVRAPHGARRRSPHLLVTLANDAWFGDSQEPWLHLGAGAAARRRAPPLPRARDQQRRQRRRRSRRPRSSRAPACSRARTCAAPCTRSTARPSTPASATGRGRWLW